MQKRCFNTVEAQQYLGVKRRFFEAKLAPLLAGKGVQAGTSVVYERADLDAAWDRYKLTAGNERPAPKNGVRKWDVLEQVASTRRKTARSRSTPDIGAPNSQTWFPKSGDASDYLMQRKAEIRDDMTNGVRPKGNWPLRRQISAGEGRHAIGDGVNLRA